jgi:hypothetical protein
VALPSITKTWTISSNNRITWVSTQNSTNYYLFGMKAFLKANGYTVKGSSNGTTAAMDGVDRWTTVADASTRGSDSVHAQSWIVLQDSNPIDILLTNQGGVGSGTAVAGYSPTQSFVLAGTATFQPTATDQVIPTGSISVSNTTLDMIWNGWVDSTKKLCRFNMASNGGWNGRHWGIELVDSVVVGPPAVFSPAVWIFGVSSNVIPNGSSCGNARCFVASVPPNTNTAALCFFGMEWFGLSSQAFTTVQPELQGGTGYPVFPLSIAMQSASDGLGHFVGFNGKLARLFDWWAGRSNAAYGDTYGSKTFIAIDGVQGAFTAGGMWPWDGSTPVMT